ATSTVVRASSPSRAMVMSPRLVYVGLCVGFRPLENSVAAVDVKVTEARGAMPTKRLAAVAILTVILLPGVAFAGSSTAAALGLGAFAVFNQILGGVGVFG